jgi:RimJ/RimL family protein N-acetyltransferase
VRLTVARPEADASLWARWDTDSEYRRLFDSDPPRLRSLAQHKKEAEDETHDDNAFFFRVRTLADDVLIGVTGLFFTSWLHRDAFLGIGLGERDYWGKGYGSDALRVILRYGFETLSLHRVSLNVHSNNPRALRSYENAGFRHEGRLHEAFQRDGQRFDFIYMGLLREEWQNA